MAEVKDNLLQLDKVVQDLNKRLDENIDRIDKLSVVYNKFSKQSANMPSQYVTVLNDTKKAVDEVTISSRKLEQQSIKESNARNALNKQREQSLAQLAKEQAKLDAALSLQNKTNAQLKMVQTAYDNLAIKKARYNNLTENEEKRLITLTNTLQKYRSIQDGVNTTVGKFQQRVGAYVQSGFNPLSNSINQLTREMPAFGNSIGTGFMAISNNIPAFFDAMSGIIAQNKELQKQGQPTKSVFSQLASSLFSMGTALSVGVTLLTLYGKDIVAFASDLIKGSKAIDVMKESQKSLNEISTQARKNSAEEVTNMKLLLGVAKDTSLSYKERNIAVKELQDTYPAYFGNLSKEKILAGETAAAELELTNAILSKAKANAAVGKVTENQSKIIDLELKKIELSKELAAAKVNEARALEYSKKAQGVRGEAAGLGYLGAATSVTNVANKIKSAQKEINALTDINNTLTSFALENEKKSILLKDKNVEGTKDKTDLNFKEIQSIYELNKAKLESQRIDIQTNLDNENITFENKIKLRQDLSKKLIEIANLEAKYEKDVSQQKYLEDIKQNATALQNKEISTNEYQRNINDISKRYSNEQKKISVSVSDKLKEIYNSDLKYYGEIQEKELEKKRKTEAEKKEFTEKYNQLITDAEIEKYKKISEAEGNNLEVRQEAFRKYRLLALEELDFKKRQEMANAILADKTDEEVNFIIAKYDDLIKKLQETKSPLEKFQEDAKKSNDAFIKSFQTDFASDSGFSKLFSLIENFKTLKESGVATALAISEAFQEAFNTIAKSSQANFDAEYSRLEQQKSISLQFAGESTAAKENIEREYEIRKKEIQKREAESQKRLAIFNIAVNTAQAIVASLAKTPPPAGLPLAALMGAIGAAQIAMVNSQQIPQFWKGTDNAPEGLAWTQEKGAEVITDRNGNVKTYGSNKGAQLTYLNKGDKVYKSHEDYINKELSKSGIQPMGQSFSSVNISNGLTAEDLNKGIADLKRTISQKENININIDKSGFRTAVNGKEYLNNRLTLKGRNV